MDPAPSALLPLVDEIDLNYDLDGSRESGHLLYLVPAHAEVGAREQAHVLQARVRIHVCVLASDHHPLTLALVGAMLADLARNGAWSNPGHGVQLAHQALAASRSLVWHPRLAGVTEPQPKVGQRWLSALGVGSYLTQLGRDSVDRAPAQLVVNPSDSLYVGTEPPAKLATVLAGARVNRVDLATEPRAPYRGRRSIELTMMPPLWPSGPEGSLCGTCGAYQVGDWCAFCNQHSSRPAANPNRNQAAPAYA